MNPNSPPLKLIPRVLFLVENNPYPQDFRVRREAEELQRRGFEVTVIAPRKAGQKWSDTIEGVKAYRFPNPPAGIGLVGYAFEFGYSTLAMLFLALWVALRRGVDVVHAANPPDTLVFVALVLKLFGAKSIFDHHDLSPEIYLTRKRVNRHVLATLNWLERLSLKHADAVISTNESYRDVAIRRGGKKPAQVFVVRNGPPLTYVPLAPDPALVGRARFLIGYVGTIGHQDGLDYLVNAANHLVNVIGHKDFLAVIVGDGDSLPAVRGLVKSLHLGEYFHFTGRLDETNTRRALSATHVCVQPDPYGQLNDQSTMNKLMEYMALGKPTVAFDLRETRFSAAGAALYATPNDVAQFASHIEHLLKNPETRARMGSIGRRRVETRLAWEHSVPHLLNCYDYVLGRSASASQSALSEISRPERTSTKHVVPSNKADRTRKAAPVKSLLRPAIRPLPSSRRPTVSIVVPCFNYGHWLAECVDSALNQESVDVDVTIVDDASSDNSVEIAEELVRERAGRVKLIRNEVNIGHIPSVNKGFRHTRGEYLVKLDADDLLTPGSLARSAALLDACPSVGFVYGRPLHFGKDVDASMTRLHKLTRRASFLRSDHPSAQLPEKKLKGWTVWPGHDWIQRMCDRAANCISQPEVMMRASAVDRLAMYDVALPHTSDLGMWLRLASTWDVGHIDGPIQGLYRVHGKSMQRTVNSGKLRDLEGRLLAFESVLGSPSKHIDKTSHMRMLKRARNGLAKESLREATRAFDRGRTRQEPIDQLIAFAQCASPEATSLPQWRSLQWRRRFGARWSPLFPPFVIQAALRPASDELRAALWWRHGT